VQPSFKKMCCGLFLNKEEFHFSLFKQLDLFKNKSSCFLCPTHFTFFLFNQRFQNKKSLHSHLTWFMLHISPCCLVVCVFGLAVQALWEVPFLKLGFFCVEKLVWLSKFLNALILAQSHPVILLTRLHKSNSHSGTITAIHTCTHTHS